MDSHFADGNLLGQVLRKAVKNLKKSVFNGLNGGGKTEYTQPKSRLNFMTLF
jgi:hypothetical protein